MLNSPEIGHSLHGFIAEGATVVWTDAMTGVQRTNPAQRSAVLALHRTLVRDGIVQQLDADPRVARFREVGAEVQALNRTDEGDGIENLPTYSSRDLETARTFSTGKRIITTLEEHPLHMWGQQDLAEMPPVLVNGYRSALFKPTIALDALRKAMESGLVAGMTVDADASRDAYAAKGVPESLIHVIHNGIDTERFVPSEKRGAEVRAILHIPCDAPAVLLIGRDSPEKGIPGFLEAAHIFLTDMPQAHVMMAGAGLSLTDDPHLRELVTAHFGSDKQLLSRLHALGIYHDLPGLYNATDILALTSVTESRPLCISEAQAAGVPVAVSTDVGDARAMIGAHGIITSCNPDEIAAAWQQAYAQRDELRFPIQHRDSLGIPRMVAAYAKIIRQITGIKY